MKFGTLPQVLILGLLCACVYIFWVEIIIGSLYVYSYTGSPYAERLLGEYYSEKSKHSSKKAAIHFQNALYRYKISLPLSPPEQRQWIEFIIGTHYECGRGVDNNLYKAKEWYQKSADQGFTPSNEVLERVNQALQMQSTNG